MNAAGRICGDLHDDEDGGQQTAEWITSCGSIDWDIRSWSLHCIETTEEGTIKFIPLMMELIVEQETLPLVRPSSKVFSPYLQAFKALGIATAIVSVVTICTVQATSWYLNVNTVSHPLVRKSDVEGRRIQCENETNLPQNPTQQFPRRRPKPTSRLGQTPPRISSKRKTLIITAFTRVTFNCLSYSLTFKFSKHLSQDNPNGLFSTNSPTPLSNNTIYPPIKKFAHILRAQL